MLMHSHNKIIVRVLYRASARGNLHFCPSRVYFFSFSWWLIKQEAREMKTANTKIHTHKNIYTHPSSPRWESDFSVPVIYFSCFWFYFFFTLFGLYSLLFFLFLLFYFVLFGNAYIKNVLSFLLGWCVFFCRFQQFCKNYTKQPPKYRMRGYRSIKPLIFYFLSWNFSFFCIALEYDSH